MNWLKSAFKRALDSGLRLPHAYDPKAKEPSFRLLSAYISFLVALGSVVALHFVDGILVATSMAFLFFGMNMVFYMFRQLNRAKIDLDDKEIELSDEKSVDNPEAQ